jgi:hypothetical protein
MPDASRHAGTQKGTKSAEKTKNGENRLIFASDWRRYKTGFKGYNCGYYPGKREIF